MLAQSDLVIADSIELVSELYACHKQISGTLALDDFIGNWIKRVLSSISKGSSNLYSISSIF